ncbi:MAG: DUF433 domain-containing protein [Methylomonas sp.]|jgi:uncharacterized protein (DUF433 family)
MNDNSSSIYLHRITINPEKCGGRPCIRGTRLRVSDILDLLAAGASFEEIIEDYAVEQADILAAIQYAARQTDHVVLSAA